MSSQKRMCFFRCTWSLINICGSYTPMFSREWNKNGFQWIFFFFFSSSFPTLKVKWSSFAQTIALFWLPSALPRWAAEVLCCQVQKQLPFLIFRNKRTRKMSLLFLCSSECSQVFSIVLYYFKSWGYALFIMCTCIYIYICIHPKLFSLNNKERFWRCITPKTGWKLHQWHWVLQVVPTFKCWPSRKD